MSLLARFVGNTTRKSCSCSKRNKRENRCQSFHRNFDDAISRWCRGRIASWFGKRWNDESAFWRSGNGDGIYCIETIPLKCPTDEKQQLFIECYCIRRCGHFINRDTFAGIFNPIRNPFLRVQLQLPILRT